MFCGYCRFAYAETIAISLFPVLFYGIYAYTHDEKPKYRTFVAIILGVSGLVLSHPFTALSAVIFALIYMAIKYKGVWNNLKTKKGLLLSISTVVMIFTLVGFYVVPMLMAKSSGLYRISDDLAVWTTYDHVSKSTSSSATFSGFLNIDWINNKIEDGKWPEDQPLYSYLVEIILVVGSWVILAISEFFTNKYLKNKYLKLLINSVSLWLLPLTFIWLIHDIVFYLSVALIHISYIISKLFEQRSEVIEEEKQTIVKVEKQTLIDIIFLATLTVIYILFIFVGQLWHLVPSIFYSAQFAWRLWSMITITCSWLFVIILDLSFKSKHRYKFVTPLIILPSLLFVTTMSYREKGVAINHPGWGSWVANTYTENTAKKVNNIGVMNEYIPLIFYDDTYKSEYANSLYTTIKTTIGNHEKYVFDKEDYISPSFLTGNGVLACTELNTPNVVFDATVNEDSLIQLPQFYYDGYEILLVNKTTSEVTQAEVKNIDSLVSFEASSGEYVVSVSYKGPTARRVLNIFFYIGTAGVLGLSILAGIELYQEKKKRIED